MYCHGPPSSKRLDFYCAKQHDFLSACMVCIVMYSHGPPSSKRLDFHCAKLSMIFCQHAWCVLLCTAMDHLHSKDWTLTVSDSLWLSTWRTWCALLPCTTFQTLDFNCVECIATISYLVDALSPVSHKGLHRAEHKLHSISKLLISQVIIPQVLFF